MLTMMLTPTTLMLMTLSTMHDGQIMITQAHLVEYQMSQKLQLCLTFKIFSQSQILIFTPAKQSKTSTIHHETIKQDFTFTCFCFPDWML